LSGIITFDKTGVSEAVVKGIPLERLLTETDAPYLTPVPYRGQRNEPAYVAEVVKKIAEWRGIGFEEVAKQTFENAKILFKI
jgi:TatD DNase family protein